MRLMQLISMFVLVLATAAHAAPTSRPTAPVAADTCLTLECHGDLAASPVVHGPITSSACDACHELVNAKTHTYRLTRKDAELCTFCHEFDLSAKPVIHKPAKLGQCTGCHDPHSGGSHALLREGSVAATCRRCHDDIAHGRAFLHTPVKEGACDSCHPPHGSRFPKLLDLAGTDLCLACHTGFDRTLAESQFVHDAIKQGCEKCHDPHGSPNAMSTTQPALAQCAGCHANTVAAATNARFTHTPALDDRACVACHTPHGGSINKLLSESSDKLCMRCHEKEVKTRQGRAVAAVAEMTSKHQVKHGPIKEGLCAGCHTPHGGDRQLFLTKYYSTRFYQRFAADQYELCLSCHDARLITETKTLTRTAFRNGEQNLHALHVRDTGERGENCRACHSTHASPNRALIREKISYGRWKMPVRYEHTQAGGSCFPGCHPRYSYDREKPIKNTTGVATTLATTTPIRRETPPQIVLDATDTTGAPVKIPQGPLPIVLNITSSADATPTQRNDARVITIVTTRPSKPAPAMIADLDGAISAELDVHAFPTTLVLKPDGSEIARLAGPAESVALKLTAYIDHAAGRITAPTTQPKVVTDDPAQKAAHTIRRVEFLIASGKPADALKLLVALAPNELPNWRYNLLLARGLIALNRHAEAKDPAQAAVRQNPQSAEAHFTLGQIYEHEQNWSAAAEQYRAAGSQTDH